MCTCNNSVNTATQNICWPVNTCFAISFHKSRQVQITTVVCRCQVTDTYNNTKLSSTSVFKHYSFVFSHTVQYMHTDKPNKYTILKMFIKYLDFSQNLTVIAIGINYMFPVPTLQVIRNKKKVYLYSFSKLYSTILLASMHFYSLM